MVGKTGARVFPAGLMPKLREMFAAVVGFPLTAWNYLGEVMGERDYERYVEHLKAHHPGCPIPTEKDYWKARWADQDANPRAQCC